MRIKTGSLLLLTATMALGALSFGCAVEPPKQPRNDPFPASQIHVDSDELKNDTAVGTPIVSRDANGLLVVTVPVRSAIDKTLYVDAHVTYFDKNGQPIGERLSLGTMVLDPYTPSRITFISPTPRADDFQLDLRYAR
jgi:hypothetical protein